MRQGVFTPKLKLLWHCEKIIDWKHGKNIYPIMVEMDLTNRCQLKCQFCTFRYIFDKSDLPTQTARKAITSMFNCGVKSINFTGGGEPTLHKDFSEILTHASDYGFDIGLFTNGYGITADMSEKIIKSCTWVRISIDAATQETFKKTKGVDGLAKTLMNVEVLCVHKQYFGLDTTIGVGFVITPENYREIPLFVELFRNVPVDYIQFKPMIDNCFESSHIESKWWRQEVEPLLEKAMKDDARCVINLYKFNDLCSNIEREYNICYGHAFCPCIGATGDLWACTHLRNIDGGSFGNLNTTSFEDIWNSTQRQEVIKNIDINKCQKYCRNNEINKVLYKLKHPDRQGHYNFI